MVRAMLAKVGHCQKTRQKIPGRYFTEIARLHLHLILHHCYLANVNFTNHFYFWSAF